MSDERRGKSIYKRTLPYRAARAVTHPLWEHIRASVLQYKYRGHSFDKTLEWNWAAKHYNRIALVNLLASQKPDCRYLEIGCASNDLFDSVAASQKTGVDPERGGTVRMTSDEFFSTSDDLFDVVFIDGLHTYDQVRRDVLNSMRALKPGGWVALHDLLPGNWIEHHRPLVTRFAWTGDVWKVAFELAATEGVDFRIVAIDYGVGVFRVTGPGTQLVDLRHDLQERQFDYFYENVSALPVIEWDEAVKWIRA